MSVLVLGGAGYIGSHTVYALIEKGEDVVIVDNLQTGFKQLIHPKAKFYQGDLRDKEFLNNVFEKEDIKGVIHFAANSLVGVSMKEPLEYYNNNVYGMKYVALRYFNACGAHENCLIGELHNPETHLIPLILQVPLKKRETIYVFGNDYDTKDGTCIRDYIHVNDLADAHIRALNYLYQGNPSQTFNLGNGEGYSVLEIINAAKEVTQLPIHVTMAPRRAGDPAKLVADNSKAKEILGWQPQYTDIKQIIQTAWNFHLKNSK